MRRLLIVVFLAAIIGVAIYFSPSFDWVDKQMVTENIGKEYFSGSLKVQVVINPERPRVGKNKLQIIIRDKDNQSINNAKIKAVAEMPAMGSMPTMYAPAEIKYERNGQYQGQFELPMMGAWPLTLTINTLEHGQTKLSFNMGTSRKGLTLASATPSTLIDQPEVQISLAKQSKTFTVDPYRRQLIGVTIGEVTCLNMKKTIRANAKVSVDQTKLTDISLKFDGWVEQLNVDYVGKRVNKGEVLLTAYSPVLVSSQEEYLHSFKRSQSGQSSLKDAAVKRLLLWGINRSQIKALERRGQALEYLPILSPVSGTVIEKNIVAGAAFTARSTLLRIADLSTLWVEGQVYESDFPWIKQGMDAQVIVEDHPNKPLKGKVTFIEPFLESETRTARIRVELVNLNGLLRPDQYVNLQLQVNLGERTVVPEQAVIFTGENRVVFVDLGEGQLQAKKIKVGIQNDGYIEVLEGLKHGDMIVTSGNFLIASESKLKLGGESW